MIFYNILKSHGVYYTIKSIFWSIYLQSNHWLSIVSRDLRRNLTMQIGCVNHCKGWFGKYLHWHPALSMLKDISIFFFPPLCPLICEPLRQSMFVYSSPSQRNVSCGCPHTTSPWRHPLAVSLMMFFSQIPTVLPHKQVCSAGPVAVGVS